MIGKKEKYFLGSGFITCLAVLVTAIIFISGQFTQAGSQEKIKSENKGTAKYQGTMSGEWTGEVTLGESRSVSGVFKVTISAEGAISGTFSGLMSGTIAGTVSPSGEINAKGSAGLGDWKGQIKIENGRLSASGTWDGYSGSGSWKTK